MAYTESYTSILRWGVDLGIPADCRHQRFESGSVLDTAAYLTLQICTPRCRWMSAEHAARCGPRCAVPIFWRELDYGNRLRVSQIPLVDIYSSQNMLLWPSRLSLSATRTKKVSPNVVSNPCLVLMVCLSNVPLVFWFWGIRWA